MILARIDSEHVNSCSAGGPMNVQMRNFVALELKDEAASKLVFVPLKKG